MRRERREEKKKEDGEGGRKKRTREIRKQKIFFSNQSSIKRPLFLLLKEKPNNLNKVTLRRVLAMEMDREF